MKIELWPIERLIPYVGNPRKNQAAIEIVANSLSQFGWKQPVVVDEDGVIVVGDTRYRAALLKEFKQVPVLVANDLTAEECKQYRIADNSVGAVSEWDLELLVSELADMPDVEFKDFGLDLEAELLKAQGLIADDGSEEPQEGVRQNNKITVIIDDMSQKAEIKAAIEAAIEGLGAHVK